MEANWQTVREKSCIGKYRKMQRKALVGEKKL